MLVCTSGVVSPLLETVVERLLSVGHVYETSLTSRTNVLVASNAASAKFAQAMKLKIPIVVVEWVTHANCDSALIGKYTAGALLGQEVVTSSLPPDVKEAVRKACVSRRAHFSTSLSRKCRFLVVPSSGMTSMTDKVQFAIRNKIEIVTTEQFFTVVEKSVALDDGVAAPAAAAPQLHNHHNPAADDDRSGGAAIPTITLGSVPHNQRHDLLAIIVALGGRIQDNLVVRSSGRGVDNKGLRSTTHLVVPQAAAAFSQKVVALHQRRIAYQREECPIVDVDWLIECKRAGKWVDWQPFAIDTATLFQSTSKPSVGAVLEHHDDVAPAAAAATATTSDGRGAQKSPEAATQSSTTGSDGTGGGGGGGPLCSLDAMIAHIERNPVLAPPHRRVALANEMASLEILDSTPFATHKATLPPCSSLSVTSRRLDAPAVPGVHHHHHESLRKRNVDSQIVVYDHSLRFDGGSQVWSAAAGVAAAGNTAPAAVAAAPNAGGAIEERPSSLTHIALLLAKAIRDDVSESEIALLQSKGVAIADNVEGCTHYVIAKPCKTETFLCAVASGKWIVERGFIRALIESPAPLLVDCRAHEWCLAMLRSTTPGAGPEDQSVATIRSLVPACALQRRCGGGRFRDWIAALVCDDPARQKAFEHVLRCGGCHVVQILHSSALDVVENAFHPDTTHVLCDDAVCRMAPRIRQLVSEQCCGGSNVPVQRLEFLVNCLSSSNVDLDVYDAVRRHSAQVGKKRAIQCVDAGAVPAAAGACH